jgi:hypothetical protein
MHVLNCFDKMRLTENEIHIGRLVYSDNLQFHVILLLGNISTYEGKNFFGNPLCPVPGLSSRVSVNRNVINCWSKLTVKTLSAVAESVARSDGGLRVKSVGRLLLFNGTGFADDLGRLRDSHNPAMGDRRARSPATLSPMNHFLFVKFTPSRYEFFLPKIKPNIRNSRYFSGIPGKRQGLTCLWRGKFVCLQHK